MENKKLIVITGCDSGIGLELSKLFLENGYTVAGSYLKSGIRNPESGIKNKNRESGIKSTLFKFKMDLRKEKEVAEFAKNVKKLAEKKGYELSGFINNAGMATFGPVENLPMGAYREIFEVNYFGLVHLTHEFIPLLIRSKGKIIIIGSTAGRVAAPFASPYTSSKFAVEGFSDSLRRELIPYGIKTVLIEPAGIATPIWKNSWARVKKEFFPKFDRKYLKVFGAIGEMVIGGAMKGLAQDECARRIYGIFKKKNPAARYLIAKNYPMEWLTLHLPSWLIDLALPKLMKMDYGDKE